jgi:hypothetical protein
MILAAVLALAQVDPTAAELQKFLGRYCVDCHGADKPKKGLRLDVLPKDRDTWANLHDRLRQHEMPPKKSEQPSAPELQAALAAAAARADAGRETRTVLRRLNRAEYQNTMRDLLAVDLPLQDLFPPDASAHGFDNVGEALHSSSFLLERTLEGADLALAAAVANGPRPAGLKRRFNIKEERSVKPQGSVYRHVDDAVVVFCSWETANVQVTLWSLRTPLPGRYRVRVSAYAFQSPGKPVTFHVKDGSFLDTADNRTMAYFDAPASAPAVFEIVERLEAGRTLRVAVDGLGNPKDLSRDVQKAGADKWTGPGLALQWIEIEGPLLDAWPPAGHTALFGELPQAPDPARRGRLEVASADPDADARRLLRTFARRAFRRPVTDADLAPYVDRVAAQRARGHTFEQAMRAGFKAVLVSPDFLFLREKPGPLDDVALASRLSYFLWSSMPDETLLSLAERKELSKPAELRRQVERLLKDPKAAAFTDNFLGQWLNLRAIDDTMPDPTLYPEFDEDLKASMAREPALFFDEVLREDLPLTRFVASDFGILDGALARLYGIPGIEGRAFRKVALPPGSHRGGFLTMAAILKVTANGTNTSPILRGAWVLERILGTPPPKPPSDVEAVEPDIRGATTIREQLAKHRSRPECASCHVRIDPPGFALESFDVIGGWRDRYRSVGKGDPVPGRRYRNGPAVDPSDVLPDGRKFRDVDEFKKLLAADPDALGRALAEKLLTYATGGAPARSDGPEIDAIVRAAKTKRYGFRSLVHEIVQSRIFRTQ